MHLDSEGTVIWTTFIDLNMFLITLITTKITTFVKNFNFHCFR